MSNLLVSDGLEGPNTKKALLLLTPSFVFMNFTCCFWKKHDLVFNVQDLKTSYLNFSFGAPLKVYSMEK